MLLKMTCVVLLLMLGLLCLPIAARAAGAGIRLAGERGNPSSCAGSVLGVCGSSLGFMAGALAGFFETEPSTGLLLVIGLGLIGGSSLIGLKMGRARAVEEPENAVETAIFPRPARNLYGKRPPTMDMSKS